MKRIKLGDVCHISSAGDKPSEFSSTLTGEYMVPVVANGVENNGIIGYTSKPTVTEPAVTVSARGNVGAAFFRDTPYYPVIRLLTLIPNSDELDVKYLYYYLKKHPIKGDGSVQAQITVPDAKQYAIFAIEDVSVQKKIASVLSCLDAKIENNNAICADLEGMARLLYDYWFVQFDFPDENGKPYKSSGGKMVWNEELKREIPEGWEVIRLGDYITADRGISYNSKTLEGSGVPMINLASFNVDSTYKASGLKTYSGAYGEDQVLRPYDLVMCNTQQTAIDPEKDIIGKTLLVPDIFDGDIVSSHHVTTIHVTDNAFKYYLHAESKTTWFHKYVAGFASGTNILGLDFNGVLNYKMLIPPKEIISKFANISHSSEARKNEVIRENADLVGLRDFLLPMLMNGQVKVKGA